MIAHVLLCYNDGKRRRERGLNEWFVDCIVKTKDFP
jgi:hypothetical protein